MNGKIERLLRVLRGRLKDHQAMRVALEEAGDLRNALSYKEKEVELVNILAIFTGVFPESKED